jgi:hypothetical protein
MLYCGDCRDGKGKLMGNQKTRRLPDDAERLFRKMAQFAKEETRGYQDRHRLTPEFLNDLGFSTPDAVKKACEQIRLYAHQDAWCRPPMYVEDGELFCSLDVVKSWDAYRMRTATETAP